MVEFKSLKELEREYKRERYTGKRTTLERIIKDRKAIIKEIDKELLKHGIHSYRYNTLHDLKQKLIGEEE